MRSAFSMTGPDVAGSDLRRIRPRSVLDGYEYVVSGHKWFTTNG